MGAYQHIPTKVTAIHTSNGDRRTKQLILWKFLEQDKTILIYNISKEKIKKKQLKHNSHVHNYNERITQLFTDRLSYN